jgi:hypothetical protein
VNQPQLNPDAIQEAAVASRHALWDEDFWGFSSESDAQDYGFVEGAKWAQERLTVAQPGVQANSKPNQNFEVVNTVEELDALPAGAIVECLTDELVSADTLPIVVKQPGNWWHGGWDWECNISPKHLIPAKIIRLP